MKDDKFIYDKLLYVPGNMRCPRCNFAGVFNVISLAEGKVAAADTSERHVCPNDGVTLERVTWKEHAQAMDLIAERIVLENHDLRAVILSVLKGRYQVWYSEDGDCGCRWCDVTVECDDVPEAFQESPDLDMMPDWMSHDESCIWLKAANLSGGDHRG